MMKNIYIPGTCVKCSHEIKLERNIDGTGAAYCPACDFILRLNEEEMEQVNVLVEE